MTLVPAARVDGTCIKWLCVKKSAHPSTTSLGTLAPSHMTLKLSVLRCAFLPVFTCWHIDSRVKCEHAKHGTTACLLSHTRLCKQSHEHCVDRSPVPSPAPKLGRHVNNLRIHCTNARIYFPSNSIHACTHTHSITNSLTHSLTRTHTRTHTSHQQRLQMTLDGPTLGISGTIWQEPRRLSTRWHRRVSSSAACKLGYEDNQQH